MHRTPVQPRHAMARALAKAAICLPAWLAAPAMALPVSPTIQAQLSGVVGLMYEVSGASPVGCTGMLVGPQTVLTAAHCGPADGSATLPSVYLQDASDPSGFKVVGVSKAVASPLYNNTTLEGDLQVVTLAQAAPTSLKTYSIFGGTVPAGTPAVAATLHGATGITVDTVFGEQWLTNGFFVAAGDSGGPLLAEAAGQAVVLGNITFAFDSTGNGVLDQFGGTLFGSFLSFIQGESIDTLQVILDGLGTPPPPPPPPPPVHYVQVGTHPGLTVIGADDPNCYDAATNNDPCPSRRVSSPSLQETSDGYVLFDFLYTSLDTDGANFDPAGYFIGDQLFQITADGNGASQQQVDVRIPIAAGQPYGFYVDSLDQAFGHASLEVSNIRVFAAVPGALPVPGSLALAGVALTALFAACLRRKVGGAH